MMDASLNDAEEGQLYQQTRAALAQPDTPARRRGIALWLLATLAIFVLSQFAMGLQSWQGFQILAIIVGVLFVHEAGHYLGMRVFGYRDLRMFFIPFFGAAVSGRKHAAPAWQNAIVLILGPLPGIALAGLLYGVFTPTLDRLTIVSMAIIFLVLINGLNLLPFAPLDGGRVLNLLVFSRRPLLESSFLLFGAVGLCVVAWAMHSWVLLVVAAIVAIAIPFRYRTAGRKAALRRELPNLPARWEDLNEEHQHQLFHYVRALDPECSDPADCAKRMKTVHEEAVVRPPSIGSSAGLLGLYAAGIVACVLIVYLDVASVVGVRARVKDALNESIASGSFEIPPIAEMSLTQISKDKYSGAARAVDGTSYTLEVTTKGREDYFCIVRNEKGQMVAAFGASRIDGP
jgi:Zn-dependent protease